MGPSLPLIDHRGHMGESSLSAGVRPRFRVRFVERTALVRFEDAELLLDEATVREMVEQLGRLIQTDDHSRLVVNFAGVRYLSSDVLTKLARLAMHAKPAHGRVQLCGLDPLVRDMLRITGLDREFDLCGDEAEALGLIIC
jgi:anti-sigma B factor antagonist